MRNILGIGAFLIFGLVIGVWVRNGVVSGRSELFFNPTSPGAARAKKEAEPVIEALRAYHRKFERYPNHLDQLVDTGCVDDISAPSYGASVWVYFKDSHTSAPVLGFSAVGGYPGVYFRFHTNEWIVDQ
jgi:hypothetical protein